MIYKVVLTSVMYVKEEDPLSAQATAIRYWSSEQPDVSSVTEATLPLEGGWEGDCCPYGSDVLKTLKEYLS